MITTKQLLSLAAKEVKQVNCLGSVEKTLEELMPSINFLYRYERIDLLIIGDPHGDKVEFDPTLYKYVIILGDYMDSFTVSDEQMLESLMYYISMAREHKNVILLLGNHDVPYYFYSSMKSSKYGCSGFRPSLGITAHHIFQTNKNLFKAAFQIDDFLFTHAGISQTFFDRELKRFSFPKEYLAEELHKLFILEEPCLFHIGPLRWGYEEKGGIFWADKMETDRDPLEGYTQIVGHTHTRSLQPIEEKGIIYMDTKEHKHEISLWQLKSKDTIQ